MRKIIVYVVLAFLLLAGFVSGSNNIMKNSGMNLVKEGYDMVIIGPNDFSSSINDLVEHKNSKGIESVFKSTQNIYTEYEGADDAEKIKYFIKDAIEDWGVSYILLIGGRRGQSNNWYVPARYVELDDGIGSYTSYFTDLYYADVYKDDNEFDNWDSNGNGIYGEWGPFSGDKLDLFPDVSLGRLPCRNTFEAKNVISKIIEYENNAYGKPWFDRVVMVGGDTFPDVGTYEGEDTCNFAAEYMDGFDIIKLFISNGEMTSSQDVIDAFNNGCGFFFTRAKGGQDRFRVVTPEGNEIIGLHNNDIIKMKNKDMYPVCILGECIHAKFDVTLFNFFKYFMGQPNIMRQDCIYECLAWRLVSKSNSGSIAVLSNANMCFGSYGDNDNDGVPDDAEIFGGKLAVEVLRLYGEENMNIIGDIFLKTSQDYVNEFPVDNNKYHCKSIQDWILIGDPSLKIGGYQ
jgi:hypothetical protein